jgi:asparagine synthase (glutamine-hydrolysing)
MCGIAGYVAADGNLQSSLIRVMCDRIRHRGPDDEGFYIDARCALGMRRLSIIDLQTGHQPLSNEDGSAWVVFNGEIYNYRELRAELAASGHRFHTNSDTEVLVHLYEQEDVEGLPKLRGMFAYAIWDARRQKILLVRDRFGKKPLYYAVLPEGLYFASELKCLRAVNLPLQMDREALRLFFQLSYVPDPFTPYHGVRKLMPGCWLTYSADGRISEGRYWRLPEPARVSEAGATEADARQALRQQIDESVRVRMIADVPIGAFLSGGIDSSCVVASMALQSSEPVKTFSIGFEEPDFNELQFASLVAKKYGTEHHEIVVHPECVSLVAKIAESFDEPFGDSSAIPTFIMSEYAAQQVKVVLSGDGGDELFGGYDSFRQVLARERWNILPAPLRRVLALCAKTLPYSAYGKNYLHMVSRPSALERYFEGNYAPYLLRQALLRPEWMLPGGREFLERTLPDFMLSDAAGTLSQAMYFEATANLTGDMLVKVDRMSMAHSLEVRCPLLDHRLAEYAAHLPHDWKIRNGKGKHILIQAVGDRLPPELWQRGKMGFGVPLAAWFRGPLRDFLWDHLTSQKLRERGMYNAAFVEYLLDEHDRKRRDNSGWLWRLLMMELWFQNQEQTPAKQ